LPAHADGSGECADEQLKYGIADIVTSLRGSRFVPRGSQDGAHIFPVIASASEAIHLAARQVWIASSRSLSSSAHSRDPLAPRNDEFDPTDFARRANHF
jgi:hypothetical protein